MSARAKLIVNTGPDRGKTFEIVEDLVHLGKAAGNQIVLSDPQAEDHHASIVCRNGRYAICTPAPDGIEVEGNRIPPEQWVWLPPQASIQVTRRTAIQFDCPDPTPEELAAAPPPADLPTPPAPRPAAKPAGGARPTPLPVATHASEDDGEGSGVRRAASPARVEKKTGRVARFITDASGEPRVKLGDDGHLPELALEEGDRPHKDQAAAARGGNQGLMLVALGLSIGFSLLLLFADVNPFSGNEQAKALARQKIAEFYGSESEQIKPYQARLRRALQAHSRGDRVAEKKEYHAVLDMLHAENKDPNLGLTGDMKTKTPNRDDTLEELLATLLAD